MYTIVKSGQRVFEFIRLFEMGASGGFSENGNNIWVPQM